LKDVFYELFTVFVKLPSKFPTFSILMMLFRTIRQIPLINLASFINKFLRLFRHSDCCSVRLYELPSALADGTGIINTTGFSRKQISICALAEAVRKKSKRYSAKAFFVSNPVVS